MFSSVFFFFLNPTGRQRFHLGNQWKGFSCPVGHKARPGPGLGSDASALTSKKISNRGLAGDASAWVSVSCTGLDGWSASVNTSSLHFLLKSSAPTLHMWNTMLELIQIHNKQSRREQGVSCDLDLCFSARLEHHLHDLES